MKSLQKELWLKADLIKLNNVNIIDCVLLNDVIELRIKCVIFVMNRFEIKILIWNEDFDEVIVFSVYSFDECFSMLFL